MPLQSKRERKMAACRAALAPLLAQATRDAKHLHDFQKMTMHIAEKYAGASGMTKTRYPGLKVTTEACEQRY
jgi:hypothetical protein